MRVTGKTGLFIMNSKNNDSLSIIERMSKMAIGDERIMVGEFLRKEFQIGYFYKISRNVEYIKVNVCSNNSRDYKSAIEEISNYVKDGKVKLDATNDIELIGDHPTAFPMEPLTECPHDYAIEDKDSKIWNLLTSYYKIVEM